MTFSVQGVKFSDFLKQVITCPSTSPKASSSASPSNSCKTLEAIQGLYVRAIRCLKLEDAKQKTQTSDSPSVLQVEVKELDKLDGLDSFVIMAKKIKNLDIFDNFENKAKASFLKKAIDSNEEENAITSLLEGGFLFNEDEITEDLLKNLDKLRYLTTFELILEKHHKIPQETIESLLTNLEGDSLKNNAVITQILCKNHSLLSFPQKQRLLFLACKFGLVFNYIKPLIEAGVDIFAKDNLGSTALHYLCDYTKEELECAKQMSYYFISCFRSKTLQEFLKAAKEVINANPVLSQDEKLNRFKAFLNAKDNKNKTPLMIIGENKIAMTFEATVKFMIEAGADIFAKDDKESTILHYFCQQLAANIFKGFLEAAKKVIDADPSLSEEGKLNRFKAFLNAQDQEGRTPLMVIIQSKNVTPDVDPSIKDMMIKGGAEMIDLMMMSGADIFVKDKSGNTVAHYLFQYGNNEQLKAFVQAAKKLKTERQLVELFNVRNNEGKTIFMLMSLNKTAPPQMVAVIANLVNAFRKDNLGNTALHYFCEHANAEQLKAFLEVAKKVIYADSTLSEEEKLNRFKALLNARNDKGETPLMFMAENKTTTSEMINVMIDAGADIFAENNEKSLVLYYFLSQGNADLLKAFLEAAKKVIYANTSLAEKERVNRFKKLLSAKDEEDETPLMFMAKTETVTPEMIKIMIEAGADIFVKDDDGSTALHYFCEHATEEQLKAFLEVAKKVIYADSTLSEEEKVSRFKEFINAQNHQGNTGLIRVVANTSKPISSEKIILLGERGANINATNRNGYTAFMIAVQTADNNSINDDERKQYLDTWIKTLYRRYNADPNMKNKIDLRAIDLTTNAYLKHQLDFYYNIKISG